VLCAIKHALQHLRRAGGDSIVNLSSLAGIVGVGGLAAYHPRRARSA
jgi:NAD(P)-dependent dehydrogenase (short-subunit alcohol dehydrogenase family)